MNAVYLVANWQYIVLRVGNDDEWVQLSKRCGSQLYSHAGHNFCRCHGTLCRATVLKSPRILKDVSL